jgi:hypothetical protein
MPSEFIDAKDLADPVELARLAQTSTAVQEFIFAVRKFIYNIDPYTYDELNCKILGINLLSDSQYTQKYRRSPTQPIAMLEECIVKLKQKGVQ